MFWEDSLGTGCMEWWTSHIPLKAGSSLSTHLPGHLLLLSEEPGASSDGCNRLETVDVVINSILILGNNLTLMKTNFLNTFQRNIVSWLEHVAALVGVRKA